ncbi:hypothetical protein H9P43_001435 [Blastocladiella emersonii ATCC 22665]|nr:hypothetical protein H9P43_001435 [Blastocladiella emersonii ATCC 22665]
MKLSSSHYIRRGLAVSPAASRFRWLHPRFKSTGKDSRDSTTTPDTSNTAADDPEARAYREGRKRAVSALVSAVKAMEADPSKMAKGILNVDKKDLDILFRPAPPEMEERLRKLPPAATKK